MDDKKHVLRGQTGVVPAPVTDLTEQDPLACDWGPEAAQENLLAVAQSVLKQIEPDASDLLVKKFAVDVVKEFPNGYWMLSSEDVRKWLAKNQLLQ